MHTASIVSTSSLESNFLKQDNFNIRKNCMCSKFYIGLVDGTILDRTSIYKTGITLWALRALIMF